MKNYIKLIRIKHWFKNGLVFLPLFFSKNLYNVKLLLYCLLGFICVSFASSIVYVLNDIKDVDKDKLHTIKKNRPLASGAISIKKAYIVIVILSLLLIGLVGYLYYIVRDLLIILASSKVIPEDPVFAIFSLPAKSTRYNLPVFASRVFVFF